MRPRQFDSDNEAGVHPRILAAITAANQGHAPSYGHDAWTARLQARGAALFGEGTRIYPVFNGTAANVVSIAGLVPAWEGVVCASSSHIHWDECGATERFVGCRVFTLASTHGKLTRADLDRMPDGHGEPHQSRPRLLSITQATELGTVYTPDEVRALADAAHDRGWHLHMDGARLANAAAALGVPLRAVTRDAGVDVLSLGGTKAGLLLGEAVVVFDPSLAPHLPYARKQGLQLASKMRFLSAQLLALLDDDLWQDIGRHANAMARRLHDAVCDLPGLRITQPQQASAVFACLPRPTLDVLLQDWRFVVWDEGTGEVRWLASWDTTEDDVDALAMAVRAALAATGPHTS